MDKENRLFFVSGTGRSGTHLVGRTIASHEEISGRIEESDTFGLITRIATTQDVKSPVSTMVYKGLLKYRLKRALSNSSSHVLEKSHPSLWLVDYLLDEFKSAGFIFVYREMEPTVSSMLEHKGVLSWYSSLSQDKPNRFLGITSANASEFSGYSIEEKCALRWQSHYNEIFRLKEKYQDKIILVKYDDFMVNPSPIVEDLAEFMGVSNAFNIEDIKVRSLDQWKDKLDESQLKRMRAITEALPV